MSRALVVEHLEVEGAGALLDWLPAAGLDLDVHQVHTDGPPPPRLPEGYDALVVMGGPMGVGDLHPDEVALVAGCQVPLLGICLGAQLLAHARGGLVERGRIGPELGVCRIHLTDAAGSDPLLAGLPPILDVVQWHWDEVVTLPPGAVHLAASPACPHQAFRVGTYAWGLQFHPEAMPSMVRRWAANDAQPAALAEAAATGWDENVRIWRPVLTRFAMLVQDVARGASKDIAGTSLGGL